MGSKKKKEENKTKKYLYNIQSLCSVQIFQNGIPSLLSKPDNVNIKTVRVRKLWLFKTHLGSSISKKFTYEKIMI